MEQIQNQEVPREVSFAIDFGTTSTEVAVSQWADPVNPAEAADYLLKFPPSKYTTRGYSDELDTTLVFTDGGKKSLVIWFRGFVIRQRPGVQGLEVGCDGSGTICPQPGRILSAAAAMHRRALHTRLPFPYIL
jgi:hypothetical protein